MKFWKISFYSLGVTPLAFIISFYTFYFKATRILGHFPTFGNPDPQQLDIYDDYSSFITFTFELWLLSVIIWFLLILIFIIKKRNTTDWELIFISGLGHLFGIFFIFSKDFEWYVD